ncbi:MAG TPA: aspartyl/asparaginyl beta-hydroxylase domain-containing protein [Dongiaceae bacterium]
MSKLYDGAIRVLRWMFDRRVRGTHRLDTAAQFPGGAKFVSRWPEIRAEALALVRHMPAIPRLHEVMREQADISAADQRDWRVFVLKAYGTSIARNLTRCPALGSLLHDSPEVLSATLSFLAPHKHVPRHSGPFRGIMRFHLGLVMPRGRDGAPGAVLEIEDKQYRLGEGDSLLWDDTFPHEVWNPTDEVRVALLLDVWRPGMPADMRLLSHLIVLGVGLLVRLRGLPAAE